MRQRRIGVVYLRPNGHAVRKPLNVGHELEAPNASFDDNESALAAPEAEVKYLPKR